MCFYQLKACSWNTGFHCSLLHFRDLEELWFTAGVTDRQEIITLYLLGTRCHLCISRVSLQHSLICISYKTCKIDHCSLS
jgi:hypothetical protein